MSNAKAISTVATTIIINIVLFLTSQFEFLQSYKKNTVISNKNWFKAVSQFTDILFVFKQFSIMLLLLILLLFFLSFSHVARLCNIDKIELKTNMCFHLIMNNGVKTSSIIP